ncbi:UDP-2,4-diacetamido-2,4,6-trideoxy-beta-L-altropyranose hydrolase [Azospirillum sp. RU38E]|nr:UDP-2,4-diacetamido-2,4,6-trideoxy-beta-L-altropyranose hydrolase [Azospirillum sp. RU38E]SNS29166.1 UDP-2,4-diacetamido-2,4,6-trideoxy-beta-L-altropyranose hydrolase [Azospirillum sp. RU37A]
MSMTATPRPPPLVLIRADAAVDIGTGHVMRCLALAEALRELGADAAFCGSRITPSLRDRLAAEGIAHHLIDPAHDAADMLALYQRIGAKALVVDSYWLDADWRAAMRQAGGPVLALDDLADRPLFADLVWNPSPQAHTLPYDRLAPGAKLLLGDAHVLIRREIRDRISAPRPALAERARILVTFGGSDPAGLTVPVIKRLAPLLPDGVGLDVVVGGSNPALACCRAAAARFPAVALHVDTREMGRLIAGCGLAITAGGGTVAEMAALATPCLLVAVVDNQAAAAADARARGWAAVLDARGMDKADAAGAVTESSLRLWADLPARADLSRRIAGIDGQGAPRVARALLDRIAAYKARNI